MCGRIATTLPTDAMARLFAAQPANDLPEVPNFNVCPTNRIHVFRSGENQVRQLVAMRWGMIPRRYKTTKDGPLLINARAETIAEKPAFREAVRNRRALVIASGFYEWSKAEDGGRDPWYITRADGAPLVIAAVWQDWTAKQSGERMTTCALVTTGAKQAMTRIHHRMPVILDPVDWPLWLGEQGHGAARLMRAASEDALQMHRVSRAVNSNRASGKELIEPLTAEV